MALKAPADAVCAGSVPPASEQRPSQISGHLFAGGDSGADGEAVAAACGPQLANHLEHIADWGDKSWKIGDHNRYVVTATLDDGRDLVLTLSSEPLEDVHCRIAASGGGKGSAPGSRDHRERLQRFGYALVDEGRGWERELRISSPRDAETAARDLLSLLTEVFGYSGRSALGFTLTRGQRGEHGTLYRTLRPDDLRKLLHGWGYQADLGTTVSGNPVIRSGTGGFKFHILFAWPAKDGKSFGCLNFVTVFTSKHSPTLPVVNTISRTSRFSRLHLDEEGDLILERDVSLSGGVATDYVRECLLDWACMMESVSKKLDKLLSTPTSLVH